MSADLSWLPDWKDADAYPDPETTTPMQWAWEFLRRNPDYQRDYETRKDIEPGGFLPEDICERYGLHYSSAFPDPASRKPYVCDFENGVGFCTSVKFRGSILTVHNPVENPRDNLPVSVRDGLEVYVRFDLSVPLKEQLSRTEEALKKMQNKKEIKGSTKKSPFDIYLRILDALHKGVEPKEIAREIYSDIHKFPEKESYPGKNKITNDIKAAKKLMQEGFISLGAGDPFYSL